MAQSMCTLQVLVLSFSSLLEQEILTIPAAQGWFGVAFRLILRASHKEAAIIYILVKS